jgi:hypothetical protein
MSDALKINSTSLYVGSTQQPLMHATPHSLRCISPTNQIGDASCRAVGDALVHKGAHLDAVWTLKPVMAGTK